MSQVIDAIKILKKEYPSPTIELNYGSIFQLLVAVILSAQCTDKRVNKVTPALFKRYPKVKDFAGSNIEELEKLIYSTGFYKNKAKNIKATAIMICADFNEKVPNNMEDLLKLPGVARKTANVILSAGFGKNEGIVVDTHVCRLSGRLGWVDMELSKKKKAVKIENKLMEIIPKKDWGKIAYLLILHGRKTCIARKPKCKICPLNKICPSAE
jgi:endonuclease-3